MVNGLCHWGCIDIDSDEYHKALDVQDVWTFYKVPSWIETSRSKGYHVWVFPQVAIPAQIMRAAGQYAIYAADLPEKTEVNPKQAEVWSYLIPGQAPSWFRSGIGNTVRLPYSGLVQPGRMTMIHQGEALSLPEWLSVLLPAGLAGASALAGVAALQRARSRRMEARELEQGAYKVDGKRPFNRQDAWDILDGLKDVQPGERDNQFYTVARLMKSKEIPLDIARRIMIGIWNNQTPDKHDYRLDQAIAKVDRAYGNGT